MKKTVTLLVVFLSAVSLMGQSAVKNQQSENLRGTAIKIFKEITNNNGNSENTFYAPNDLKQAMDSLIFEEYSENSGWRNYEKEEFTWNDNGQQTGQIFSAGGGEDYLWFAYHKEDFTYDNQNKLTTILTQERDIGTDWMELVNTEFTYGNASITVVINYFSIDLNQWVAQWKYEYSFDANGSLTEVIVFGNADTREIWVNQEKYEYHYDNNNKLIQELDMEWSVDQNDWNNTYKYDYTYGENGLLENDFSMDWNQSINDWQNNSKTDFTADENSNIVEYIYWSWDYQINEYYTEERGVYTYNNAFSKNQLLLPNNHLGFFFVFENIFYNHMLLSEEIFEAWDNDWNEDTRTTYFYSEHNTSGIELHNTNWAVVYPNPASDLFSIDLNNDQQTAVVEIYDIGGRLMFSETIVSKQSISLTGFESGVYLYKIIGNTKTMGGKLVVE